MIVALDGIVVMEPAAVERVAAMGTAVLQGRYIAGTGSKIN